MGVPKFFRYISERYPNLSELVGPAELPTFDNMYLDMNGIIHVCSHPDDSNVHFRMSEDQMFQSILHYIDTLFRMIQPQKVFFMAVDGVAPRAKMNQQRGRRFQSAKTALDLIEKAKKAGEKLPEESRFDSNCITPGTPFMVKLQEVFKHFVKTKLSTDPLWQHCRIILSGHETPGEGEHKIMEYIRYLKSQPDYDPNTRHCLYGLDADLIMLGLCSHELNFALLREEVRFDKKAKRPMSVDETQFYLLHLGLLREYLELEFIELKAHLKFPYDLEKIIDDWIFMCFMVGNDFIPHLPNLHINSNALPLLYKVYKTVLPKLDGYLNEAGKLNLERFEVFMEAMSEVDRDLYREHYEDLKLLETKYDNDETFGVNVTEITAETKTDLDELVKKTMLDLGSDDSSTDSSDDDENPFMFDGQEAEKVFDGCDEDDDLDDDELFEKEFRLHKRNYYMSKMNYPEMTEEVLAEQTRAYITAVQWILNYYYRGVCSWSWYYPHHYAPYMSDIKNFKNLKLNYNLGHPFLPFEQLLSVLPAASKELLPTAYHRLMTDPSSKIIEYYPVDFLTDLNGKKQEWEALVLIPFIDETKLIDAMNDCNDKLTDNEKSRNIHGPMLQYDYFAQDQGSLPEAFGLPMVGHVFCKETQITRNDLIVPEDKLVLGPCQGALKSVYFPGFPTMRHLKHSGRLDMKRIKVFQQPSRNESMIICIDEELPEVAIGDLYKQFIGKEIHIGWPHLREAKVFAVSDTKTRIESSVEDFKEGNREFILQSKHVAAHHLLRLGIDLGDIKQLLHVYPLQNREYVNTNDGKLTLRKNWSKIPLAIAPISVVRNIKIYQKELERFKPIESVFTKGSVVFLMTKDYYGCEATISDSNIRSGRIKISTMKHPQPDFYRAKQKHRNESQSFMNPFTASSKIGLNVRLFNRITSVVLIVSGEKRFPISDSDKKTNVGLNLKHLKQNEEIPGYTKSMSNQWFYSQNAIDLVDSYYQKFPKLFELMNKQSNGGNDFIFESELNAGRQPGDESMLKEIQRWLKEQPSSSISRQPCGTECLSQNCIEDIISAVNELKDQPATAVRLQIKPHLLYKPNLNDINVMPDREAKFQLFDRVVIARDQYTAPLGLRGTIISILPTTDPNPVRQENINVIDHIYEILFDSAFERGIPVAGTGEKRLLKVRKSVLINISHGMGRPSEDMQNTDNSGRSRFDNGNSNFQSRNNAKDRKMKELRETFGSYDAENAQQPNFWLSRNQPQSQTNGKQSKRDSASMQKQFSEMRLAKPAEPRKETSVLKQQPAKPVPEDTGEALKKLLRIGNDAPMQINPVAVNNEARPIDLNALFGKAASSEEKILPSLANLPKPPANWHQKPKPVDESNVQNKPMDESNIPNNPAMMTGFPLMMPPHFLQQGMPHNIHPMHLPYPMPPRQHMPQHMPPAMFRQQMMHPQPNYPMMMMHGPLPFTNPGHHVRIPGPMPSNFNLQNAQPIHIPKQNMAQPLNQPEGPGNLKKEINKNASYNSAFIPLQAARKITKNKSGGNLAAQAKGDEDKNNSVLENVEAKQNEKPDNQRKDNKGNSNETKTAAMLQERQPSVIVAKVEKSPLKEQKSIQNTVETAVKANNDQEQPKEKPKSVEKTPPKRLACNFSIKPVVKKQQSK